jgi:hypothetical protein
MPLNNPVKTTLRSGHNLVHQQIGLDWIGLDWIGLVGEYSFRRPSSQKRRTSIVSLASYSTNKEASLRGE